MRAVSAGRELRATLAQLPTGVVIVTAATAGGAPLGMTMNSFVSVSLDPPLVLFCIDRRSLGLAAWLTVPGYAINVLSVTQTGSPTASRARVPTSGTASRQRAGCTARRCSTGSLRVSNARPRNASTPAIT
jgi:flavin reductase (DIM6/NTAB) family NADH-FMN oxidoreductase RutF